MARAAAPRRREHEPAGQPAVGDSPNSKALFIADGETADLVAIAGRRRGFPRAAGAVAEQDRGGDRRAPPGAGARQRRRDRAAPCAILSRMRSATPPAARRSRSVVRSDGRDRVLDRGPGVPAAEREQIFRRFWRRDRRRGGNAGLGLAIVARIAEMHGAEVTVEDRPGGGAVFAMRFPAVLAPKTAAASPDCAERATESSPSNRAAKPTRLAAGLRRRRFPGRSAARIGHHRTSSGTGIFESGCWFSFRV